MGVTRADVEHVAHLARLELSGAEIDRFTDQLNGILAHFEELAAADTAGDVSAAAASVQQAPLRSDDIAPDAMQTPPGAMAPAWTHEFFTVPRLAALDTSTDESSHA